MSAAELYALLRQNGMLASGKRDFGRALLAGQVPVDEVEKFAAGEPSALDELVDRPGGASEPGEDGTGANDDSTRELTPDELAGEEAADLNPSLPLVSAEAVLDAAASGLFADGDEEAARFLVASGVAKLWRTAYNDLAATLAATEQPRDDLYAERIRGEFRTQYVAAASLVVPAGYAFRPGGPKSELALPNLMQRHVAADVRDRRRVGNWSGTGAGKTLSAVLASRVIGAGLTVICCPNAVVGRPATQWQSGSGWVHAIASTYPDSRIAVKTLDPEWGPGDGPRYLIVNYETFQQPWSEARLKALVEAERIDFIVVDEIHYAKQRGEDMSQRKRLVQGLISAAGEANPDLAVLGMSATPVINNLQEGKSLVELVTTTEHPELETRASLANAMALHQRLVTLGSRWMPSYEMAYEQIEVDVDCADWLDELRALGKTPHAQAVEAVLTQARIPTILEHIEPRTVIYTHYVDGIVEPLRQAITAAGWKVGVYTGDDKTGLDGFLRGELDVLIGTSTIGTGVDGLQRVSHRMIVNALPWTAAEFEQLKGRLYRQGQTAETVAVVIPRTYAEVSGERWSWCQSRIDRIRWKKSLADAAVDGVVPAGELVSVEAATKALMGWLDRLERGETQTIHRPPIVVPLDGTEDEVAARIHRWGDFSAMNRRWNATGSAKTHERLADDPTEWMQYHTLYRQAREHWPVVPFEVLAAELGRMRAGKVVGDLGCGEAGLAKALAGHHTVHSFDHVAIDDTVTACDIADVPLAAGSLDVAVLCLALMGANCADYVREAHRLLDAGGQLRVVEPAGRIDDEDVFRAELAQLGFDVASCEQRDRFVFVTAVRADRTPDVATRLSL